MTPQANSFVDAAHRALADARTILGVNVPHQAARLAYYGQFHAARALIFERTSKISKTHKGVDKEFHRLAKAEAALPPSMAAELSAAYRFKERADYDVGNLAPVTQRHALDAIVTAERFVATIQQVLTTPPHPT